jgi:hypothetical protein
LLLVRVGLKEARLQNPVPTNRNRIRGIIVWVSKHIIVTPKRITKGQLCRYGGDWRKEDAITWGGLRNHELIERRSQPRS